MVISSDKIVEFENVWELLLNQMKFEDLQSLYKDISNDNSRLFIFMKEELEKRLQELNVVATLG